MDVKFFYSEHDYQRNVMGLPDAATVSLIEDNIRLVILCHLHWKDLRMDAVCFSPFCLFQGLQHPACRQSSRDCLYFSCRGFVIPYLWSSVLVVLLLVLVWLRLSDVLLQLPLLD